MASRVHLATLGCRLNEAELESWARDFRAAGHQIVPAAADADLVVVNTCAVTGEAVRKSRQMIRKAQRANPRAKLVVSGCYTGLPDGEDTADLGIDLIVPNPDKEKLVERASAAFNLPDMPAAAMAPEAQPLQGGRHRAFIKVQDGCRYRCTYCIVTHTRGEERSRPIGDIVREIDALAGIGVQEAVLTGVHLGGYGAGMDSSLVELVQAVLEQTDIPRLRLGSLEPWDLPPDFWRLFENPRLMPHLHLPMQSGSDSVLRRMARRCRSGEFEQLAEAGRAAVPDLNITTDLIVGFPGETAEEWQQTLAFAERLGFGHIHIFAYSARAGTKAARLPDQINRDTKRERSQALHELAERGRAAFLAAQTGKTVDVLYEAQTDHGWSGYTPNYLKVFATSDKDLDNKITASTLVRHARAGGHPALQATFSGFPPARE